MVWGWSDFYNDKIDNIDKHAEHIGSEILKYVDELGFSVEYREDKSNFYENGCWN